MSKVVCVTIITTEQSDSKIINVFTSQRLQKEYMIKYVKAWWKDQGKGKLKSFEEMVQAFQDEEHASILETPIVMIESVGDIFYQPL